MKNYGNHQLAKEGWLLKFDTWFANPGAVRKCLSDTVWIMLKAFRNSEDVTSLQELLNKVWEIISNNFLNEVKSPEGFIELIELIEA